MSFDLLLACSCIYSHFFNSLDHSIKSFQYFIQNENAVQVGETSLNLKKYFYSYNGKVLILDGLKNFKVQKEMSETSLSRKFT